MILVTVGTGGPRFDRLLRAVDAIQPEEELVVQHGPSAIRPRGAECHGFFTFDQLVDKIKAARVVVTHGGVGSVMTVLAQGKQPIVMARLAEHGEVVDDHQLSFARRTAELGLVRVVGDELELAAALRNPATVAMKSRRPNRLVSELAGYIAAHVETRLPPVGPSPVVRGE
jgi:UDP-N-acetylglucosamine transferase subunit ALG13